MKWQRGYTLLTSETKRWSQKEREENDKLERTLILSGFSPEDAGRGRMRICVMNPNHPDYEKNVELILKAPEMEQALSWLWDILETAKDGGELWCAMREKKGAEEFIQLLASIMIKK